MRTTRLAQSAVQVILPVMSYQRIRDPLHNLIEFDGNSKFERKIWELIQTGPMQRLRRIKQLGFSEQVYPGATHTRFAHSLGVFHTARTLMKVIEKDSNIVSDPERKNAALAAALLHDVGHGPFSHAFENVGRALDLKMAKHELVSDDLIRDGEIADVLKAFGSGFASDVANLVGQKEEGDIYSAVVSSQFDADRLDYMQRDRLMTGTHHGAIDLDWLISNLEVGSASTGVDEEPLEPVATSVLGPKAIFAAETYVLSLFQLYPTVYLHKATRGAEQIFAALVTQIVLLVRDGSSHHTGLSPNHPLIRFASDPGNLQNVLLLDDSVILGSLSQLEGASDTCISYLAKSLALRRLYRCIDIRSRVQDRVMSSQADALTSPISEEAFELMRARGLTTIMNGRLKEAIINTINHQLNSDVVERACAQVFAALAEPAFLRAGPPAVLLDETRRKPYKPMQETKGPLDRIQIRAESGQLVDVASVSRVIAAVPEFKLLRAYIRRDDKDAEKRVLGEIEKGVQHALAS